MKVCLKCGIKKASKKFRGKISTCTDCLSVIFKHKVQCKNVDIPRHTSLFNRYKSWDKHRGYTCDLTSNWIRDNITSKECYYCGSTIKIGCDRIDNSKGHTMDNVVPCCVKCNTIRNVHFTSDEMKLIAAAILKVIPSYNSE